MLSQYYNSVVQTEGFKKRFSKIIDKLQDKKVLIYGAGEAFQDIEKKYNLSNKLNIVAIADLKFPSIKDEEKCASYKKNDFLKNFKTIAPDDIKDEKYDAILVTNEHSEPIVKYLKAQDYINEKNIEVLFVQEFKDESINLSHLHNYKFEKTLPQLIKKLKGKKVVLYGAGAFLQTINKYYDLSGLNIIGIADKKYEKENKEEEFLGYKTYSPDKIKELNPDYVVVSTKYYIDLIINLYDNILKDTKIKIKPLVKRSFWTLFKEAMN